MKLADDYYSKKGLKFFMITLAGHPKHTIKKGKKMCPNTCRLSRKDFYMYKRKTVANRGTPVPTFWEEVNMME